jgi:hypothetical protein
MRPYTSGPALLHSKGFARNPAGVRRINRSIQTGTRFGHQVLAFPMYFIPARRASPISTGRILSPRNGTTIAVVALEIGLL